MRTTNWLFAHLITTIFIAESRIISVGSSRWRESKQNNSSCNYSTSMAVCQARASCNSNPVRNHPANCGVYTFFSVLCVGGSCIIKIYSPWLDFYLPAVLLLLLSKRKKKRQMAGPAVIGHRIGTNWWYRSTSYSQGFLHPHGGCCETASTLLRSVSWRHYIVVVKIMKRKK